VSARCADAHAGGQEAEENVIIHTKEKPSGKLVYNSAPYKKSATPQGGVALFLPR